MDWKAPYDEGSKPEWMPQTSKNGKYHPCNCGICFFCVVNKKTSTIAHGKVMSKPHKERCSGKYEGVKRNYCVICVEEAKHRYPTNSSEKRLRKLPAWISSINAKEWLQKLQCCCM